MKVRDSCYKFSLKRNEEVNEKFSDFGGFESWKNDIVL